MNRFEAQNTAFKIDGYFFPTKLYPSRSRNQAFTAAKVELVEAMQKQIRHIEEMTIDVFESQKRKDFS